MENQPINNPSDTSSLNSTQINQPSIESKANLIIPILLTLLVSGVVFGCAGYYLHSYSYKSIPSRVESPQQNGNVPTPSPVADSSEIKTFTSSTYGFSFQYPGDLEVKEFKDFGVSLWNVPAPTEIPMEAPFPPIHIMVLDSKQGIDAWVPDLQVLRTEKVKVGDSEADMTIGVVKPGPYYMDDVIYYTYLSHNGKYYLFRLDKQMYPYLANFYQEILASFKFTN